jgi:hypothetical protein
METGHNPFPDAFAFKLRDSGENVKLQFPCRCAGVDALAQGDESNPERLEFIEQKNQVTEVPPEAVQSPTHEDIEPASLRITKQFIESGPAVLRAGDAAVHIFVNRPRAQLTMPAKFLKLILRFLVQSAHPSINRCTHQRLLLRASERPVFRPFDSSHIRMARRTCSETCTPSRSHIS